MVFIANNTIVYLKFAKRVDLKCSHHKKKKISNYVRWNKSYERYSVMIIYLFNFKAAKPQISKVSVNS